MTQIAGCMPAPAMPVECSPGPEGNLLQCRATPSWPVELHIRTGGSSLVCLVQSLFSAAAPDAVDGQPEPARLVYEISEGDATKPLPQRYRVRLGGRLQFWSESEDQLLHLLERSITDQLTRSLTGYHLFHSGAVARNGRGVMLPAASGAGKSTLVAALALSGFDYLSDEVAVFGSDCGLRPFPKVISLRGEGWERISMDFPTASRRCLVSALAGPGVWYLRPPRLADDEHAIAGYPVDFVVFPAYNPLEETELRPIPKSLALKSLIEQSLDLPMWGETGFNLIVRLVRRAQCYSLGISSLRRAVGLVEKLALQEDKAGPN